MSSAVGRRISLRGAGSERHDYKQRIAGLHRALMAAQHNRAGSLRENRSRRTLGQWPDDAQLRASIDEVTQRYRGFEDTGMGRGVMDLQVSFLSVSRSVKRLLGQFGLRGDYTADFNQQILQTSFERREILGQHVTRAVALGVDGGNLTVEGCAQTASRQERACPNPEVIKARRHRALSRIALAAPAGDVADPRVDFEGVTPTVQINVVGRMREELGIEEVRELRGGATLGRSGKGASQVPAVDGMTALTGGKGGFVEHRDQNDGAAEVLRLPTVCPLAQQRRAFVFVAVGRAVDDERRPRLAAPDPSIEPKVRITESEEVASAGEVRPSARTERTLSHV